MGRLTASKKTVTTEVHGHVVISTARPFCAVAVCQLLTKPLWKDNGRKYRTCRTGRSCVSQGQTHICEYYLRKIFEVTMQAQQCRHLYTANTSHEI
jgi:hypothetical protein